jgi:hypothetical protein
MEDVLDLYSRTSDEKQARVVFDERPCQLIGDSIVPLPMQPGKVLREDYEYERKDNACILLAYDLDRHQRYVEVRERRTKKDYAEFMQGMIENHYTNVDKVHLVQDNLNTHQIGSFYEHLAIQQAHALKNKLVFHFTPKHGSWLNMAEIEFSALGKQCLDRRISSMEELDKQVQAWVRERNERKVKINWLFDTPQARTKLKRHYIKLNPENALVLDSNN